MATILTKRARKNKQILDEAAKIFSERDAVYGNANDRHGKMLAALFPDGITLKTEEDFCRFMLFNSVIGKINRYAENINRGGHRDSALDPINALAMLVAFDEKGD